MHLGKHAEALADLSRVLALQPSEQLAAHAHVMRGNMYGLFHRIVSDINVQTRIAATYNCCIVGIQEGTLY